MPTKMSYQTKEWKANLKNGYELRKTTEKGEGVFATRFFESGEIVMFGRIEKKLYKDHSHASQIAENEHILHVSLITRVNHSCNPDCGIRPSETGTDAHDFVAMRNININEEITFDYAMRNYDDDHFSEKCKCGSERCRGKILGWKNLPNEKKKEYDGFVAPYLLSMDLKHAHENVLTNQNLSTGFKQGAHLTLIRLTLSKMN